MAIAVIAIVAISVYYGVNHWFLFIVLAICIGFLSTLLGKYLKYKKMNYQIGVSAKAISRYSNNSEFRQIQWGDIRSYDFDHKSQQISLLSEDKNGKIVIDLQIEGFEKLVQAIAVNAIRIQDKLTFDFDITLPPEPISCLECGHIILTDEMKCSSCGWTYSNQ